MKGISNLKYLLIEFILQNLSKIYFYTCQKTLKRRFKTVFKYKITFWICVLVLWIHKCIIKKMVWNVSIKAFWYTNTPLVISAVCVNLLFHMTYNVNFKFCCIWKNPRLNMYLRYSHLDRKVFQCDKLFNTFLIWIETKT